MLKDMLPLPDPILFETQIPVQIYHINYGNHLGHDMMVSLLHEARVRFLKRHNYSELDIEGCRLVVQQLNVIYKKEVHYGEILSFNLGMGEVSSARADLLYSVKNDEQKEVCRAKTTLVFLDRYENKVTTVPAFFMKT